MCASAPPHLAWLRHLLAWPRIQPLLLICTIGRVDGAYTGKRKATPEVVAAVTESRQAEADQRSKAAAGAASLSSSLLAAMAARARS